MNNFLINKLSLQYQINTKAKKSDNRISSNFVINSEKSSESVLSKSKNNSILPSFRAMKKSQFSEIDRFVVEKFKAPIEKFNLVEDLQFWLQKKIETLKLTNFGGRNMETVIQRKNMIEEWVNYVTLENSAYTPAIGLIILSAITSLLGKNDDNIPPVLNKGVLADTVCEAEEIILKDRKTDLNFHKMYEKNLRTFYLEETSTDETETKWIIIPSGKNDSKNLEANVEKLKSFSYKTWCTKSNNAKPYLEKGDFHIYLEKGMPKLGVRFVDDEVVEIQGEKNDGKIPVKYFNILKQHSEKTGIKFSKKVEKEFQKTQKVYNDAEKAKNDLGESLNLKTQEDAIKVFEYFNMKPEMMADKTLSILTYKQPSESLTFFDLGINENKFFKYVSEIRTTADFANCEATDLGILSTIGEVAYFWHSKIKDLQNLTRIGGAAYFANSQVENLGNLREISGSAYFQNSLIKDLGNLTKIGFDAEFQNSQIESLGELRSIGNDANFSNTEITDLHYLTTIGGFADFSYSKVKSLGALKSVGDCVYIGNCDLKEKDFGNVKTGEICVI